MTSVKEAERVLQRYVTAWKAGDIGEIVSCYADNMQLHYFGNNPFSGTHTGRDNVLSTLAEVSARAPRELIDVDELVAHEGGGVLVVRERLTVGDQAHEISRTFRYRIEADRFVECWLHEHDQALIDRAWSGSPKHSVRVVDARAPGQDKDWEDESP